MLILSLLQLSLEEIYTDGDAVVVVFVVVKARTSPAVVGGDIDYDVPVEVMGMPMVLLLEMVAMTKTGNQS